MKAENLQPLANPEVAAVLQTLVELSASLRDAGAIAVSDQITAMTRDMSEHEQHCLHRKLVAELLANAILSAMPFVLTGIDVTEALQELVSTGPGALHEQVRAAMERWRARMLP